MGAHCKRADVERGARFVVDDVGPKPCYFRGLVDGRKSEGPGWKGGCQRGAATGSDGGPG